MIRNIAIGVGATFAALVVIFVLWFTRPWSDYSPAKVWEGRNMDDRTTLYRSMETRFPYREVAGAATVRPLGAADGTLDFAYEFGGEARTLDQYAAEYDITGLLVMKDGQILLEEYWRGETPESQHTSWSVAKSFIGALVGTALRDGKIDSLDDPVAKYAPVYEGTDYGSASIRDLLAMSSGIDFIEDYEAVGSDMRKLFFNVFFMNQDVDQFVRRYRRDRDPATDFVYQSPNTMVLAAVVRGAYGENVSEVAAREIFEPAGMAGGTWLLDRNAEDGKELGYCCLNITLRDYARFGQWLLDEEQDPQNLPDGWTTFVRTPPAETHMPNGGEDGRGYGYGHHFWLPPGDRGERYFAAGYNGQAVWMDPETSVVVAMTSADRTQPSAETHESLVMIMAAMDAAAAR